VELSLLDWCIVGAYLLVSMALAGFFIRRAGKGSEEFFASGRSMPWWLLGTSMVATTFATDTPNLVTEIVRTRGVSGNWIWWAFLITGMMTVFFYARLWRRSGVMTDLEFYEIRYSGRPAAFLRGFRAIYLGLFFNCVIMAAVTLAAVKISSILFGLERTPTIIVASVLAVFFSVLSGLWGVVVTDLVMFGMAMVGSFCAAWFALQHPLVGGLSGLLSRTDPARLAFLPDFSNTELAVTVFILPLAVQWWAVWYPGAEPGGGSYVAQRMLAARDERHAFGSVLWFNLAHYALRPWPWLIVGLCSVLVYPELEDIRRAFPQVQPEVIGHDLAYSAMLRFIPSGFLGVMVGSLFSAYLSTMDTHLNWGSSYLVHDFYRRFVRPDADERHYVRVGRIVTVGLMVFSALLVYGLESARSNFDLMLSIGAGTGSLYLLRWFWWRVNAWGEISAMIGSFLISIGIYGANHRLLETPLPTHWSLLLTVLATTVLWIVVTLATPPTDEKVLSRFVELVRPLGPGWNAVRKQTGVGASPDRLSHGLLGWFAGCVCVYSALFGTGYLIYGRLGAAAVCLLLALSSGWILVLLVKVLFRPPDPISDGR